MLKKFALLAVLGCLLGLEATDYELERIADWQRVNNITQRGDHLIVRGKTTLVSSSLFPVQNGKHYELEAEAKALGPGGAAIKVGLKFYNASGVQLQQVWCAQGILPFGGFAKYKGKIYQVPAGATQFRMVVDLLPNTINGAVELKDIEVEIEP